MAFRILVIDDEPQVRDLLRRRMEMCGHEVVEAMDGEDAIEALENEKIDVVIADILMPKKDGLEVIMYVRKEMPNVKTIAISASHNRVFLQSAKFLGASVTLEKPFRMDEIEEAVRGLLPQ